MVQSICKEIELRRGYLDERPISSIYFGGGTPSLLEMDELELILSTIRNYFIIEPGSEITLEANPDDLTPLKLSELKSSGINRLSIGIQSFFQKDLDYMNRAHNSEQAYKCVLDAKEYGFEEISIDLIYGTPTMSEVEWIENLQKAFSLHVPHISAYCLTVEEGTALYKFVQTGKSKPVDEETSSRHFAIMLEMMEEYGYEQYEISNFSLPGKHARHNSSYWKGDHYLGIGPSAHSFNGQSRQWNISNNQSYIKAITAGELPFQIEYLSPSEKFNERLLTGLRTKWGCSLKEFEDLIGASQTHTLKKGLSAFIEKKQVELSGDIFKLTDSGKLMADAIASSLFII